MIQTYCGNCLDILPTLKLNKAIIVTDPPFNVNYHYRTYKDNLTVEEYYNMLSDVIRDLPSVIIHYPEALHRLSITLKKTPSKVVSWVYNSNTPKQHRDIAFYDVKPDFTKVVQPYKNLKDKRIQKRILEGFRGGRLYDWWNVNQVKNVSKEKTCHPCQMPLEVMKNIIGILPKDFVIVDPFMGSGTTGKACKLLNRDFIGIEIDEEYYQIATARIEEKAIQEEIQNEILLF